MCETVRFYSQLWTRTIGVEGWTAFSWGYFLMGMTVISTQ